MYFMIYFCEVKMISRREVREMLRNRPIHAVEKEMRKNMGRWLSLDYPGHAIELCEDKYTWLRPISETRNQIWDMEDNNRYRNDGKNTWMDISKGGDFTENDLIGFPDKDISKKQNQQFTINSDFVETYNGFLNCNGPNSKITSSCDKKTKFIWQPI